MTAAVNTKEVLTSFDVVMAGFTEQLSCFSSKQINAIPFEESWTPAQVGQHMILANGGFAELLKGAVKGTERAPDEKVPMLKGIFLDFTTKLNAPDAVVPAAKTYDKDYLLKSLKEIRETVDEIIQQSDLTETCDFDLPFFGYLTKLEAVEFMTFHTRRHAWQLNNIWKVVENK